MLLALGACGIIAVVAYLGLMRNMKADEDEANGNGGTSGKPLPRKPLQSNSVSSSFFKNYSF